MTTATYLKNVHQTHDATLREMAELHRVSTFAIFACNVAGVEASSTSATFHVIIAYVCLLQHRMQWF